jgi:hypothetical protein
MSAAGSDDAQSTTAAAGGTESQALAVIKAELSYNDHLEELIASEAEKALVLRWLHNESEALYSRLNSFITLPVICISTVAGTISIGQDTLFGKDNAGAPIGVGVLSLVVSILNVISSFFGWAKRSEGHRISGINYAKLHRWISIELALPREQRMPAKHFLKEVRAQVDRLNETSPPIPPQVVEKFQKSVKGLKDDVSLPEICNQIHAVVVYPGHVKTHAPAAGATVAAPAGATAPAAPAVPAVPEAAVPAP